MEFFAAAAAWGIQKAPSPGRILETFGIASLLSQSTSPWADLTKKLSTGSSIVLREDSDFGQLASRWREWHGPDVQAVVTVFNEHDVAETIKYANQHDLPFVAFAAGHGMNEDLFSAKDAILINLREMDDINVAADGHSALIGPGTKVKKVINDLWAQGKQTVTGVCECVSVSGPALGGGHGWLQGQYGLAIDQVISAQLVTPEGDIITVSDKANSDLFWALRGAGHNFGIVTQWHYRVYDVKTPKWPWEIFVFPGSKLEQVLDMANYMMDTQAPEVANWLYFLRVPDVDPHNALVWIGMSTDGAYDQIAEFSHKLHAMEPLLFKEGQASLPDLASETYMGEEDFGCQKGNTVHFYPVRIKEYNKSAARAAFDEFDAVLKRVPELAKSMFLLEGYSNHGVQAVNSESTAYPHRDHTIMMSPSPWYSPNSTIDSIAQQFGENLRQHILKGTDDPDHLNAYVNYAGGNEPLEASYGWELWRLERLRALKAKWDPNNRMRYYIPIV